MAESTTKGDSRTDGFERLITHLATEFINVPIERIEDAVRSALQKIGEFAVLHRASLVLFDESRTVFDRAYEWCRDGVRPGAEIVIGVPLARYPWARERFFKNEILLIRDAEDMPVEAISERTDYRSHGVGSLLVVPMMTPSGPIGTLSFAVEDLKTWSTDDINLLRIATEMFVNVFERERSEKLAAKYQRDLERSNADLEDFAYHASHDLQEPLRMVTGYCEMLEAHCKEIDPEARELIARAVTGTQRMKDLVNALLRYSGVGKKGPASSFTDCNALLEVTLSNLEVAIRDRGARVTADPLPTVTGDSVQLGQVFQNLLSNAIKFSDGAPRIHVAVREAGDEYVFSVRDNGIGIPNDGREHLFEAFHRLHSQREFEGTGIGLAICKKVIVRNGGRIWAESIPGKGATFHFTLPKTKQAEQPAVRQVRRGRRETRAAHAPRRRQVGS